MTEKAPEPEAQEQQRTQPRDAAYWATRVERLEVSDVPEGAANVNVWYNAKARPVLHAIGITWQIYGLARPRYLNCSVRNAALHEVGNAI